MAQAPPTPPTPPARACLVEMPIRVGGYDVDFQNVVHNTVYVRWFEDLRFELCERFLPMAEQMAAGYGPMLTSTHVDYKRPVRLFDRPLGRMWVSDAGGARWTVQIEIAVGDTLVATGEQSGVFVDLKTLRLVRVPEVFKVAVEQARAASGSAKSQGGQL